MADSDAPLDIAVIGGGIVGLHLVLGLLARGVRVTVYEQARAFREIGAGISLVPNAVRAMALIDARTVAIYDKIKTVSGDPDSPTNWYAIANGYERKAGAGPLDMDAEICYKVHTPPKGFESCYRATFLDELVRLVPDGVCVFGKRLLDVEDRGDDEKLLLKFEDGTTAEADAVIGCDGVKSTVKKLILPPSDPASRAYYAHTYCYRGLVSMDRAISAVGPFLARNRMVFGGPKAHLVTYPISSQSTLNLVAMVHDAGDWAEPGQTTTPASKAEAAAHFADWTAPVRALLDCLPDDVPVARWALFDTAAHPAPTYRRGRVAIAGDAAHASTPHHGAGAAMGIEDALALAALAAAAGDAVHKGRAGRAAAVRALLAAYDTVRRPRSQWVVESSSHVGKLYEWMVPELDHDWEAASKELQERSARIWDYDVAKMVDDAVADFGRELDKAA